MKIIFVQKEVGVPIIIIDYKNGTRITKNYEVTNNILIAESEAQNEFNKIVNEISNKLK